MSRPREKSKEFESKTPTGQSLELKQEWRDMPGILKRSLGVEDGSLGDMSRN